MTRLRKKASGIAAALLAAVLLCACAPEEAGSGGAPAPAGISAETVREVPVRYAEGFRITELSGGQTLIDLLSEGRFLLVPEGAEAPAEPMEDVTVLRAPVTGIYLAATSAMDFFRALGRVSSVRLSGTDEKGWTIGEAKEALRSGEMLFAGKYSAPDYELIFSEGCRLAIESTMIYHKPEVREQLERLGVPVLVERSSYEKHPLGRMEWIKVYGALAGTLAEAEAFFDREAAAVEPLAEREATGKTVAFFYVTTTGTVSVRASDDYVPRMIEMAGGAYAFPDLPGGSALSTVNVTMESFYDGARDADVLIYNSAIDGELFTVGDLLAKSPLFADFRAVREGNVWCTGKNLFQEPTGLARLILDMDLVLRGENVPDRLTYLHRLAGGGE